MSGHLNALISKKTIGIKSSFFTLYLNLSIGTSHSRNADHVIIAVDPTNKFLNLLGKCTSSLDGCGLVN